MAAPLPTSYNPLTLKIAFASGPMEVSSKDEPGPSVTAARRAVGHLYGLNPQEVDALALWCWDDEGHAHGLTEDMMVSASTLATRCGTSLRLICVPGVSAGRTVKLGGEVGAQQVVQQPLPRDLENGPRSSVNGPIRQQVATPPVQVAAAAEEKRAEVAAAPAEAIKAEAKEKKPEGQGEGQAGDAESTASGAGGSEAADGEGEGGVAGGPMEQSKPGPAEGAGAGGEALAAEAPPATTHEPLDSGAVLGHDIGHENSEMEARQAHRMDVTVFSPEVPHHVQDVTATEAEARASMRMD